MDATTFSAQIKELREVVLSLQGAQQSSQQENQRLVHENQLLRQRLQLFIKRYFGGKQSEKIDQAQLELLLAGLDVSQGKLANGKLDKPTLDRPRKKANRQPLPNHLPVEEIVLQPREVEQNPQGWKEIGREITEELDWKPAQFIKRLYIRPKYVAVEEKNARVAVVGEAIQAVYTPEPKAVLIAPLPSRLIEKGLPGAGLLAQVIISKYEDHLPLYRQEKIYWERHGVKIRRATLSEWVEKVAQWLKPIYETMKATLLKGGYLQADETSIRYLDPDLPGKSHRGFLWAYSRPGREVIFEWRTDRSRAGPEKFLESYKGLLQTDGYNVYGSLAQSRPQELILLGCMAHARRKFHEALEEDRRAGWFIRQIGHLYGLEKAMRQAKEGPALRQARRGALGSMVLVRLEKAMQRLATKVLPKSKLGVALHYALERWAILCRYVEYGQAEIDNNAIENSIRPTAIGKKNFLFVGHPKAGWRSAVIYSLLGSCRRLGINPHEYLQDILKRLPDMKITEIEQITPVAWAQAKKKSLRQAA